MKKNKKIRFWINYHLGILLFSALTAMFIKYRQTGNAFVPETILVIFTIFFISVLVGYLAIFMIDRASRFSHGELTKKVVPAFIIFLVGVVVISNVIVSVGVFIWYLVEGIPLSEYWPNLIKNELSFANKSLYMWLMFFSIAFFYVLWRKSAQKEQLLREEKLKYQYQTLKSQINPHFLFNSFNTLSELMHDDISRADDYVQQLSKIYRYIIDNEENKLVGLNKELDFVNNYFNLQKVRNGEKIRLVTGIKNPEKYQVVPVSVQSLVENAIKHNSASKTDPLEISIFLEDDTVVVKNNFQKKTTFETTTQTGLNNLKEQVRLILNKDLNIIENNKEFIVKVPILG